MPRFFAAALPCLWLAPSLCAADASLHDETRADANFTIIVAANDSVLFKVPATTKTLSCTGKFTNADGDFDGPIQSSVRVKFGAAAEGKSSPCEIALARATGPGKPPTIRTTVFHIVVPKIVSRTLAHVPGRSDDRTDIGVGEKVLFKVEPAEWFLDADCTWRKSRAWDALSNSRGVATIYTSLFPRTGVEEMPKDNVSATASPVALTINDAIEIVTISSDGVSERNSDTSPVLSRKTPAMLTLAYAAKLGQLEAPLVTHQFSTAPVALAVPDELHRAMPLSYRGAKGLEPMLVALATLQSRSTTSETGQQPPAVEEREIRLVARMVFEFHRPVNPAIDLSKPPPNYFDATQPAGCTILPGHWNIEGRYQPKDIREPELRRQFAKSIADNNAKISAWNEQSRAREADDTMRRFALEYLQDLRRGSASALDAFKRELIALGTDAKTADALTKPPEEAPGEKN